MSKSLKDAVNEINKEYQKVRLELGKAHAKQASYDRLNRAYRALVQQALNECGDDLDKLNSGKSVKFRS